MIEDHAAIAREDGRRPSPRAVRAVRAVRAIGRTAAFPLALAVLVGSIAAGAAGQARAQEGVALTDGPGRVFARQGDPWLDRVRAFAPGDTAGFGADLLPGIVLGRPEGLGATQGSLHVVSLGKSGSIIVSFHDNAVVDGPGDDLVIFENAFHAGSDQGPIFTEYAFVEVSGDGKTWHQFPVDEDTGAGLAGQAPVFASSDNAIDPLSEEAGGDRFDIGALGLHVVRFVRLTDAGDEIDDYGNHSFPGTKGGFDLDAAAALHSVALSRVVGTVTQGGEPAAGVRVHLRAEGAKRWRPRRTRADGGYRFARLLPETTYTVRVGSLEEGQQEEVVLAPDQRQARVDFVLP